MEAAGAMDAQNAPTAPWKTTEQFSTSFHRHCHRGSEGDISNELRTGTFLTSLDTVRKGDLTGRICRSTLKLNSETESHFRGRPRSTCCRRSSSPFAKG